MKNLKTLKTHIFPGLLIKIIVKTVNTTGRIYSLIHKFSPIFNFRDFQFFVFIKRTLNSPLTDDMTHMSCG